MSVPTPEPSTVSVTILQILSFGILVRQDDGTQGIVRARETVWDYQRRDWRKRFKVGDTLMVLPLREGHDHRMEFSLRLAENDPWVNLETDYPLGKTVEGTVIGVQNYGVFVEIAPGITGLLHITRLPIWAQSQAPKELLWPDDKVKVTIERIDPKNRRIGLSLGRALNERWPGEISVPSQCPVPAVASALLPFEEAEPTLPPWTILVVEDDQAQLGALAKWMRQVELKIRTAGTAEAALELLADEQPDLVISDFGLPGMSGAALLKQVREHWPEVRCALMTDWARTSEYISEIDALHSDGIQLLVKPLRPADIIELLTHSFEIADEGTDTTIATDIAMATTATLLSTNIPLQMQLKDILERLCATTGAAKAVIFAVDSVQRKVSLVDEYGRGSLNMDAMVDLVHSPVRDVAEDRQVFYVEDTRQVEARVRYLKPLLAFQSCLGLRLPARLHENYALFLFSPLTHAFGGTHREHAVAGALAASALIEREQFQIHALEMQGLALLGQLSRALVHEINHQLSPINFVLNDIGHQLKRIEQKVAQAPDKVEQDVHEMRDILQDLIRGVEALTDTARIFGRLTVQTREQTVNLGDAVLEVVQLVRDMSDRAHIRFEIHVQEDLPPIRLHTVQLQQMLLNIVVNAIQQIQLARPSMGGWVRLEVTLVQREHHQTVQIRVEDDGPGIHHQLWKHIFDLGFTTRAEGGGGLGLYISNSLAESMNGRVYVESSYILWGTTFVVELPIAL